MLNVSAVTAAGTTGRIAPLQTPTLRRKRELGQRDPGKDGDGAKGIRRVDRAKVGEKEEKAKDSEEKVRAKAVAGAKVYIT
jgi:hypothetical protein